MNLIRLLEWIDHNLRSIRLIIAPLLVILVGGVCLLVYLTGGIKFVYSHSMYIPILLAGFVFGVKGGVSIGLIGGVGLGPFMPIDVAANEMQHPANWLYRTGFFVLIGFFSGLASDSARYYIGHLKWISRHDASTKLPNRLALFDRLGELVNEEQRPASLVLAVISLENKMELKSAFGFAVVEEAIRQLAGRFEANGGPKRIYRTETAQIGLLIGRRSPPGDNDDLLADLVKSTREPVLYNGIAIHIDTRMGTVAFGQITEAPEVYLQKAEAALAAAREEARDRISYSPRIKTVTEENLAILGGLRDAINNGQLSLHYQPKIFIRSGEVQGVEALLRWNHPHRGNIPPGAFIPRAEQSTLIQLVTEFALEKALAQAVSWRQKAIDLPVAINISPHNLLQPGFTDLIEGLLEQYGLSGEGLELEITEQALMRDRDRTIDKLARLAASKITISIDDFGAGYSSLQYLHQLPVTLIKIDQSFVHRLPGDGRAASIVEAAVTLAHKMGIKTGAEGVETRETLDFLGDIGCDLAQGFWVSRPMAAEDFAIWYRQNRMAAAPRRDRMAG